jgi:sugar/nucleoside kinase (ribokinase family)
MRAPIVVLTNIIIDDVWLADGRHFPNTLGGAAVYAAVGAKLWWDEVGIVAGVGSDLADVTAGQLDTFGLRPDGYLVRGPNSIQSRLVYQPDGTRTETPYYGREHFEQLQFLPRDIPDTLLPAAGTYIFRDLEPAFWADIRKIRSSLGVVMWELQDDAAFPQHWQAIRDLLGLADLFSLNAAEACRLFNTTNPEQALDHLLAAGPSAVVLRMGAEGAIIALKNRRFRVIPPPAEVVDVTGGGNAFTGGFLAGWISGFGYPETAARFAAAAAAHALGQYGPADPRHRQQAREWAGAATIITKD